MKHALVLAASLFLSHALLWGKRPQYRLWLATKTGKIAERALDVLERRLSDAEIQLITERDRYGKMPHLAMPVCTGVEYYLFSPAEDLLAVGCVDPSVPGLAAQAISNAMANYAAEIRKGVDPTVIAAGTRGNSKN